MANVDSFAASTAPAVLILGVRGIPAAHGGFETFAEILSRYLVEKGWNVTVYCQGSKAGLMEEDYWHGVKRIHVPTRMKGTLETIEFDVKSTINALSQKGVILTLGYNTGFLALLPRLFGRHNYINMDGIEWKRKKYGLYSKIYLWINERLAAWSATMMIADHPEIAKHLARGSASKINDIAMIPYGGTNVGSADVSYLEAWKLQPAKFFTVIARPEPENQILEIVQAFSEQRINGIKLVVLGQYNKSNAYHASILNAANENVLFPGPIYDLAVLSALRFHSLAYVHGHQVGGTNPSLVEALGAGNAIIGHDNKFNRWVAGDAALYFDSVQQCGEHMASIYNDTSVRHRLRVAARQQWFRHFTWDAVLDQYRSMLLSKIQPAVERAEISAQVRSAVE